MTSSEQSSSLLRNYSGPLARAFQLSPSAATETKKRGVRPPPLASVALKVRAPRSARSSLPICQWAPSFWWLPSVLSLGPHGSQARLAWDFGRVAAQAPDPDPSPQPKPARGHCGSSEVGSGLFKYSASIRAGSIQPSVIQDHATGARLLSERPGRPWCI